MTITIQHSVGLNGVNNPDDVLAGKSRLVELGFPFVTADSAMGPLTIKAIRLFQAMKNGFNVVNDQRNDGRVDVNGDTVKWLQAVNAPQWQRMPAGSVAEGFLNDNIADVTDNHDFGTNWRSCKRGVVPGCSRASQPCPLRSKAAYSNNDVFDRRMALPGLESEGEPLFDSLIFFNPAPKAQVS